jgi:hypothetical protein
MAGVVLQYLVAEQMRPLERCHMAIWSDNTPAASWSTKMADKASTPVAGQLLRALVMWQRTSRSALPTVTHCAGSQNLLADMASRSFRCFHHGSARGAPLRIGRRISNSVQSNLFSLCPFTDELVATRLPGVRAEFARDLDSSWQKVAHATVDGAARTTHWRNWGTWCSRFGFDKFLTNVPQPQQSHVLMAFAARVRAGAFGNGRQIGCQAVATALHHVAQAFVLANYDDPRGKSGPKLGLAFTRLYHSYRNEDPAPRPQLALPVSAFQDVMSHEGTSIDPKELIVADLVVIAFFFLL